MTLKTIIFGGSAGSLDVILRVLPEIRTAPSLALIFVLHRKSAQNDEVLTQLLASRCLLPVKEAEDKENIASNTVYLAPPGYHLLIEKDATFSLDISEKVNYSRPSIDVSFITAAEAFRKSLIGVLLSGGNSDGTNGLRKIKQYGGSCFVQDPKTAQIPFMPEHAYSAGVADAKITPEEISHLIQNPSLFCQKTKASR